MAKRFTDTSKYKKPFIKSLPGAYKLLWDFLYHDCDHAGIWIVDMEIAQSYVGRDMPISKEKALSLFNTDEVRIIELSGGKKWFISSFIEFQYGKLSEKNRAHISVISILQKHNLLTDDLIIKPLTSPLQGAMDKDKEMDKEQEMDKGGLGEKEENQFFEENEEEAGKFLVPEMLTIFCRVNKKYHSEKQRDFPELLLIANTINRGNVGNNDFNLNNKLLQKWKEIVEFISTHSFYKNFALKQINTHIQSILQAKENNAKPGSNNTRKPSRGEAGQLAVLADIKRDYEID